MDASEDAPLRPTDARYNELAPWFFPVEPIGQGCFRATPTNHEFR